MLTWLGQMEIDMLHDMYFLSMILRRRFINLCLPVLLICLIWWFWWFVGHGKPYVEVHYM